ncbi:sensor histidine kinase [Mucilaginibacter pocheonensis]|uniref:Sensor histidine kinase YesM n=1 Tax=Mucilaginibacter pocheonensis TaxID=398050 RepID=A0ABU1TBZ5_9SPHI|nr:histidine kinase [Mucilaginibacter pocheonensis]MDR6942906.1 sensor histidine kinase YesM [Mucilaginibacter pocheonensis]
MKINNEILFNLLFWTLYFLYQWLGLASLYTDYDKYFINACMALPVSFLFSLLAVHVFFKRIYHKNKKVALAGLILCSFLLLLARRYINYYIVYPKYFPQATWMPFFSFGKILTEFVNLYTITGLYALYYFIRSWYRERNRVQELLQQKTMAELDLLKAQVQPHFIFNMLNNIYATALKTSPDTAALISHLSGFLDYSLYNSSQDKVPLTTEIDYLKNYIELQKSRYGGKLDVSLNIYNEIGGLTIVPLLLLPLIENCFKHGVAGSIGKSWVRVDVSRQDAQLSIKIENSKEEDDQPKADSGGIGLANVRKRLDLLYPDAHEIKVINELATYLVILKLKIK